MSNDDYSYSTNGDDTISTYQTTDTLYSTLTVNSILFFSLLLLFECNRHIKPIFLKRVTKRNIKYNRVPSTPSRFPLSWIWSVSQIPNEDLCKMIGLDGYMYLRYISLCFRFSIFTSFLGIVCLVPIYHYYNIDEGWARYTLANIPNDQNGERLLWVPAVFSYVFAIYFCHLLHEEYKHFVLKRFDYLIEGDFDTPPQTYYTLFLEKTPAPLRSEPALRKFFEKIFPGDIYSVNVALDLHELEVLTVKRHQIRNSLEKSVAIHRATQNRPTKWISYMENKEKGLDIVSKSDIASFFGFVIIDAIRYYEIELKDINETVSHLQEQYNLKLQADVNKYTHKSKLGEKASKLFSSRNVLALEDVNSPVYNNTRHSGNVEDISPKRTDPLLDSDQSVHIGELPDHSFESDGENCGVIPLSPISSKEEKVERGTISEEMVQRPSAASQVVDMGSKFVHAAAHEGYKTAKIASTGVIKGVLEASRALELLTIGAYYSTSSTAFITMNSRVNTSCASQMLLSQKHYTLQVKLAPNPNDIIWGNISVPQQQINMRQNIADFTLVVGALFWSVVVGGITTLANLESLSKQFPYIETYQGTLIYKYLNSYLAAGLLLLLLSLLPIVFDFLARFYENKKLESEVQSSIMSRYFYYQLANVFVSVGLGSIAARIHEIVQSPASILTILGSSLPNLSIYFTNLIVVKIFTVIPLELIRPWPLIQFLTIVSCADRKKYTTRELQMGPFADQPMLYGWYYPSIMMVLMIMATYSCIAPLLLPFCVVYFGFQYLASKYQLLYVFVTKHQSGGFMWYAVFSRSLVCMGAGVITLTCYLGIRETFISGPFYFLLPLPFGLLAFYFHCDAKFRQASEKLSLESAIDLDKIVSQRKENGKVDLFSKFNVDMYRQPSLSEGIVTVAPYRNTNIRKSPIKSSGENGNSENLAISSPTPVKTPVKSFWDPESDAITPEHEQAIQSLHKDTTIKNIPQKIASRLSSERLTEIHTVAFLENYLEYYDTTPDGQRDGDLIEKEEEIDAILGTADPSSSRDIIVDIPESLMNPISASVSENQSTDENSPIMKTTKKGPVKYGTSSNST